MPGKRTGPMLSDAPGRSGGRRRPPSGSGVFTRSTMTRWFFVSVFSVSIVLASAHPSFAQKGGGKGGPGTGGANAGGKGGRDAYDRAGFNVDLGLGGYTGPSGDSPDAWDRAKDRGFGVADSFSGGSGRSRGDYPSLACRAAIEKYTWSCVIGVPAATVACTASRNPPTCIIGLGVAVSKCAVDTAEVDRACGSDHGGRSPAGSPAGAAAATGL